MEQFENLFAHITTEWDGTLLIIGDFNIDLLDRHSARVVQYKNVLDSYNLHQHYQLKYLTASRQNQVRWSTIKYPVYQTG